MVYLVSTLESMRNIQNSFRRALGAVLAVATLVWLSGCRNPISADKASPQAAYQQATATALNGKVYSSETRLVLHRFNRVEEFKKNPAETLKWLHEKALVDERKDLLYALSELSYLHAENLLRRKGIKPWEPKPAHDYFLCSAIYAHLYLSGEGKTDVLDPRNRVALELYNRALARGFMTRDDTNGVVVLESGVRKLPPGSVKVEFSQPGFPDWKQIDHFVSADDFVLRGLTIRNQQPGLGGTLIGITVRTNEQFSLRVPATIFLRVPGDLKQWRTGETTVGLELYSGYDRPMVEVRGRNLPLRTDTTAPLAHTLNQSFVWSLGMAQFFSAEQQIKNGIYPTQPYRPGRIPVVFVHGTFSSPIWWAEMWNTLRSDPHLSERYQFWNYIYNSGNMVTYSAQNFRESLTNVVQGFDPEGKDPALKQIVVIGHSQGGLLTKMAVTDPGDKLWRALTDKELADLKLSDTDRQEIERTVFFKPVPFVTRAVFISTPHRGSYMSTSFVRKLALRFMSLPGDLLALRESIGKVVDDIRKTTELRGVPTSLDGMSPKNPLLLALAEIPPAPGVKSHSIIPVKGDGPPETGKDGIVSYQSAHVSHVDSELVVRDVHSCQSNPVTIEEVRRILLEHLNSNMGVNTNRPSQ